MELSGQFPVPTVDGSRGFPYGSGMSSSKVPQALDPERVRQGATLKTFRELRGLKVSELANAVPMSYSYLSNIEAGRKPLTPQLVARFAALLDVRQIALVRPDAFSNEVAA